MEIKDALQIGDLIKGKVMAGHKGVNRKITSIEVMEVPELVSWVTPGLLVMTAFYSNKDDADKQIEIVQTLIDKNAAGIVIKMGRFIQEIPERMLVLADENTFPIITIPKEVSYINVLTPLYETLYEEKKIKKENVENPFSEFRTKEFTSLSDVIENIYEIVNSSVYIEDTEGRLLYVSKKFLPDGWRDSNMLFSKPKSTTYLRTLEDWGSEFQKKTHIFFKMLGFRDRIVVPLYSNKKLFATLHMLHTGTLEVSMISGTSMKGFSSKISELFMNEQLFLQKERMEEVGKLEGYLQGENKDKEEMEFLLIRFQAEWISKSNFSSLYLVDHSCLIRKRLYWLVNGITSSIVIIFEKYQNFYALLVYGKDSYLDVVKQLREVIDLNVGSDTMWTAVGPAMKNIDLFEESIRFVDKTMEIGHKLRPEEKLYTYDKLGIYEILLNLTSDKIVQGYTYSVLNPLLQTKDKQLIETLKIYLEENGNISKASEILFIHRRTLTYRIQKIEELLNMKVDDAESRFILMFCLNIKGLSN